jgi:hypothetical protein
VRADFEWMRRVGIGGVQNIDASIGTPKRVEKPIDYLTPEWRNIFKNSVDLAQQMAGHWLTRKETWAEQARPWIEYLSRSAYLLQQGRFVADVAYLYGEDANITGLFWGASPPVPRGYNYDFVNSTALLNEFSVRDGQLVTRSGMSYRVLALDQSASQ